MTKRAVISVDIQNDYFPNGKWPLVGIDAAAANAARVIAAARKAGDLVVHIRHEFAGPNAPFFLAGSDGAQIHPVAACQGDEPVILKHFINSFRETGLKDVLDRNSITDVVIIGNMSHMCVDGAARASADFGYGVTVVHDACATLDLEFNGTRVPAAQVHAAFMAALAFGYATVVSTGAYINSAAADAA
jgi:nicotinamidase-related amidase